MKTMFDEVFLGNLHLKNRLVRSATLENGCIQAGKITPELGRVHRELAGSGVGLIITGMMGVARGACVNAGMAKIYGDSFVEDFKEIAEAVHRNNGKIVVQLGHCGAKSTELDGEPYPFAPSDADMSGVTAKAMSVEQIKELVAVYGIAAKKCMEAGADGVQIHAAHGYLISQFLSPIFNHRTDQYGGSIEGRAKLLLDAYAEIRKQVGAGCPVLVKINYSDIATGGIEEADVLWFCKELDRKGIDAIEVSSGIGMDAVSSSIQGGRTDEAFNAEYALRLSRDIGAAVVSVGGYRSPEVISKVLNDGGVAAISICRPLIREPGLPNRWKKGDPARATCISCGKCFGMPSHGCYLDQVR